MEIIRIGKRRDTEARDRKKVTRICVEGSLPPAEIMKASAGESAQSPVLTDGEAGRDRVRPRKETTGIQRNEVRSRGATCDQVLQGLYCSEETAAGGDSPNQDLQHKDPCQRVELRRKPQEGLNR